jgi:adenosine 3'-phospho 5'-phosphosulfate transporter B2
MIVKCDYKVKGKSGDLSAENFIHGRFLELTNHVAGLVLSGLILLISNRKSIKSLISKFSGNHSKLFSWRNWPPLFICSLSSLSDVLSSWFQYESLKYATFTSQLLAKSSLSLFVMLAAKRVSNRTYKRHEYLCVGLIGLGIFLFSDLDTAQVIHISSGKTLNSPVIYTSFSGIICLLGFLLSDSFTVTWQDNLINNYAVSSIALMFITNVYSFLYTLVSLSREHEFTDTLRFMNDHSDITMHIVILSLTSAFGQIFIFVTIQKFGAFVFSIILITRQVVPIVFTSTVFEHVVSTQGTLGLSLMFFAIFVQLFLKSRR